MSEPIYPPREMLYVKREGNFIEAGVTACSNPKCRVVRQAKAKSDWPCCVRYCDDCGKQNEYNGMLCCNACRKIREDKREQERFDKAKKFTMAEYNAQPDLSYMVFDPQRGEFCSDLDDFECYYDNAEEELEEGKTPPVKPKYVWLTTPSYPSFDARYIEEHLAENGYEDYECEDVEELETFLNTWLKKQPISYDVDYSRCLILEGD